MTRWLFPGEPPRSIAAVAAAYALPPIEVQRIFEATKLEDIELFVLALDTATCRQLPLSTALYLVKAEWMLA